MKLAILIGLSVVTFIAGCSTLPRHSSHAGTTRIAVSGTAGIAVRGFYVQDGQRVAISNAVPWTLDVPRLSRLEMSLPHPGGQAVVDLAYDSSGDFSRIRQTLDVNCMRMRVRIQDGFVVRTF